VNNARLLIAAGVDPICSNHGQDFYGICSSETLNGIHDD